MPPHPGECQLCRRLARAEPKTPRGAPSTAKGLRQQKSSGELPQSRRPGPRAPLRSPQLPLPRGEAQIKASREGPGPARPDPTQRYRPAAATPTPDLAGGSSPPGDASCRLPGKLRAAESPIFRGGASAGREHARRAGARRPSAGPAEVTWRLRRPGTAGSA